MSGIEGDMMDPGNMTRDERAREALTKKPNAEDEAE
jgi:hypothetical protein